MIGQGKYDPECTAALTQTQAQAVLLIILGGTKGSGFSMSIQEAVTPRLLRALPTILRDVASQIERDAAQLKNG